MISSDLPNSGREPTPITGTDSPRALDREVEVLLRRSGYLALRGISCEARDGMIHLRGRVPTFFLKQVAQALVSGAEGVRGVVNQIEVDPAKPALPSSGPGPHPERRGHHDE